VINILYQLSQPNHPNAPSLLQLNNQEARDAVLQYRARGIPLVFLGIGAAFDLNTARQLQVLTDTVADVSQLGTAYNSLVPIMRQALGIETSLTDPPTPPGGKELCFLQLISLTQNRNSSFIFLVGQSVPLCFEPCYML
jgi:hypothetical protein